MGHASIDDLLHDYADAVVCRDGERWAANWDEDGVWELAAGTEIKGRSAIYDLWKSAMGSFEHVVQTVLNRTYQLDEAAGTGTGRQYLQEQFERGEGEFGIMVAYYDDEYVRRGDHWFFASRKLVPVYQGTPDLTGNFHAGRSAGS